MTNGKCKHGFDECERCSCSQEIVDLTSQKKDDMVNRPSHYNYGDIECIDAIKAMLGEEGFRAYCKGNALKYTWRAGLKFKADEDLKKAVWYNRMAAGDDPRLDPNEALRDAADKFNEVVESGEPVIKDDKSNYVYWSNMARLSGWTPPDTETRG